VNNMSNYKKSSNSSNVGSGSGSGSGTVTGSGSSSSNRCYIRTSFVAGNGVF